MPRRQDPIFKDAQGRFVVCAVKNGRTKFIGSFRTETDARKALKTCLKNTPPKQWVHYY